jgi:hypothetical protein
LFATFYLSIQAPPRTLDPSSKLCPLVEEGIEMIGRRFLDSVLDSGIFVVGGALLVVVVGAILVLGPTAIERWF